MAAQVEALLKECDDLFGQQDTVRTVWQELADYTAPNKATITVEPVAGEKRARNLFDSSAPHHAELLAASLSGTLTSNAQKWFGLVTRQAEFNKVKPVRDYLEEIADRTYLALNQSNFTSEVNELYNDLVVFGTGALFVEEAAAPEANVFGGFRFQAIAVGDFAIAEAPDGRVNRLFRRLRLANAAVVAMFGEGACGPELVQLATDRPNDLMDVYHGIYPRPEGRRGRQRKANKRFASCYFMRRPAMRILRESGFDDFPFAVPRWRKVAGEVYGRGPAHTALPDIRTLNEAVKLYLEANSLAVRPPLAMLEDSINGEVSLEPAALNVERERDSLRAMDLGGKFQVAENLHKRLEEKIADLFYIRQLHLKESPQMTATEVVQRQEEMQRFLGPTAGRLHSELLSIVVELCIAIQLRANVLPPPPRELVEGDPDIDITYEGPLARAQKTLDLVAIERKNAWIGTVLPFRPEVMDLFDWDEEGRHVATVAGVPPNLVHGAEDVDAMRAQRAKQQQQAAQLQALAGTAEAAGKAAPMAKVLAESAGGPQGVAA